MSTWLSDELKSEVKKTFEPRYKRGLSDEEVVAIADNLANFTEHLTNFYLRNKNGIAKKVR